MRNIKIIFITLIFLFSNINSLDAQDQLERNNYGSDIQIETVNNQISQSSSENIRYEWDDSFENNPQSTNETNKSKRLGYILGSLLVFFLISSWLYDFTRPKNIEERRKITKEKEAQYRLNKENQNKLLEEKELQKKLEEEILLAEKQKEKEEKDQAYILLRKEIEAMPEYEHWRQSVFKERGRKCSKCTSTENLEIDHRFKSFYLIIKENNITNIHQAYECASLWNVNNGAPLCKTCHDKTSSSIYRKIKTSL